ncbi:PIN domain-containing protein [Streptomyces sp. NPDC086782]|uniref:PIN domain-containing protein n=1 Tax=Streptomyces sp. NPDC086782 TaxID=3365757 RepID=UPI0037FDDAC9
MIILDTSILRSFGPQSSSADLLRTIKTVGRERVGAPWMVMEELAAQQAIKYQELHERAAQALEALRHATPWGGDLPAQLSGCDTERAREHWRSAWGHLVEVIPTSDKALRQALFREANCLAPCRESKSQKIGSRDAAIWLSAVEYATEHPKETVYFVSANTKDFGDGTSFPHPMNKDVARLGNRFVLLTSMNDVAALFTEPAEVDKALVTEILKSEAVSQQVYEAADALLSHRTYPVFDGIALMPDGTSLIRPVRVWLTESAHFGSVGEVQAYRIGDHEWCTASVDWHLVGLAHTEFGAVSAAVSWPTVVLFSLDRENPRPTVLREATPRPVSADVAEALDVTPIDATVVEGTLAAIRADLRGELEQLSSSLSGGYPPKRYGHYRNALLRQDQIRQLRMGETSTG